MRASNLDEDIERFETTTKNAGEIQKETLRKILEQNRNAEYLQKFGLGGKTDSESFRTRVPLITHQDLEPYMQRIVDGDSSHILTNTPITSLSLSTGTTQGKSKHLIFNEAILESTMQIYRISFAFINREYPIEPGKSLQFIYASKQLTTRGGLIATTGTTNIYRSERFAETMKALRSEGCSPAEVVFGQNYDQSLYCHLLCGLIRCDEVQFVSSAFAYNIVHAFRTFEHVWEELCDDIREGTLSRRVTVPSMRESVCKLLTPDRALADSIRRKCARLRNWYGLIPELWPNAKYVYGIMTGSMEPYAKKLEHYAGTLPLLSAYYGASEGWVGANVNPASGLGSVAYAVFPDIGYFEFIPKQCDDLDTEPEPDPVGLTQVETGKEYEIVVTNFAGLYRYRLGDVVRVAGFHNSTPELQFVRRRNLLLSITNNDKTSEEDVQLAIREVSDLLATRRIEVVDFACLADTSTVPGHYVAFLELNATGDDADDDFCMICCNCLDRAFAQRSYVGCRNDGTIGPLELRVVKKGTFERVMDGYVAAGANRNQFKMPRCVSTTNEKILQIFCQNVVGNYFSTAYS